MNASIKRNKRLKNRAGRRIRAQRTRNNKEKRSALLSLNAETMVNMAKVAKASFNKNCLSNVASSHLKRGSFELAKRAVEENYAHNC